jgi:hypothetical protein
MKLGIAIVAACTIALGAYIYSTVPEEQPVSERIKQECRASYGSRGEQAVLDCQVRMAARYLLDAERKIDANTYKNIGR